MFSVLIPCFNTASFLKECVQSVLRQCYRDFELIALDDGSTDDTYTILEEFQREDARIRLFRNAHNQKTNVARNQLLKEATHDFVCYVDSDDRISPLLLEKYAQVIATYPYAEVLSPFLAYINEKGVKCGAVPYHRYTQSQAIHFLSLFGCAIANGGLCMPRKLALQYLYDETHGGNEAAEDYEMLSRLIIDKRNFNVVPKTLYFYRVHHENTADQRYNHKVSQEIQRLSSKLLKHTLNYSASPIVHQIILLIPPARTTTTQLREALQLLTLLSKSYVQHRQITSSVLQEIRTWTIQRKLRILTQALSKQSLSQKTFALFYLLQRPNYLLSSHTWSSIYGKILWILYFRLYEVLVCKLTSKL